MPLFDGYMAVDWSANGVPKRGADSIWIACTGWGGADVLENPATRAEAVVRIEEILRAAEAAGLRLLCGFDFPFGYPEGTAKALTGGGWQALWALIAARIADGPDNTNNRFDVGAELNALFPGDGPFWGNGLKREVAGLPRKKPLGWGEALPPNHRFAEHRVKTAQEVWKLSGAGSVGGQALMGIAALERLRHRVPVEIWPFETLGKGQRHVLAEIYPSLVEPDPSQEVKDAGQVLAVVTAFELLDRADALAQHLAAPHEMPVAVRREEACILGQDAGAVFRDAAKRHEKISYIRDPRAIYARSFATVRAEADLTRFPADIAEVAIRLIHACGMVDLADDLAFSPDAAARGRAALTGGASVLCDCEMVAAGVIRRGLPSGVDVRVTLNDASVPGLAAELGTTRSAAAVTLWEPWLEGAVVAIGNAPTALFQLLEMIAAGGPKPALILGFPVGFVGAAESKAALEAAAPVPYLALRGRRGGSALASAAVNGLALGLAGDGTR